MIKTIVKKALRLMNVKIIRANDEHSFTNFYHNVEMIRGLERCKRRGLDFKTVIDVGAAAGSWSLAAEEKWPNSNYVLFEPLLERQAELTALCDAKPNFNLVPAAAGAKMGTVNFSISEDLDGSGVAAKDSPKENVRSVRVCSIDEKLIELNLPGPYLIKLDTHGFEVPILEGAKETLKNTKLLIVEVYGFKLLNECLLFHQLSGHLEELGFRLIDIVDIMRREKDEAFWQADAFFISADSEVFKNNSYK